MLAAVSGEYWRSQLNVKVLAIKESRSGVAQPPNCSFTIKLCHVPCVSTSCFSMVLATNIALRNIFISQQINSGLSQVKWLPRDLSLSWLQTLVYCPLVPPLSNSLNGLTVRVALPTSSLTSSHIHIPPWVKVSLEEPGCSFCHIRVGCSRQGSVDFTCPYHTGLWKIKMGIMVSVRDGNLNIWISLHPQSYAKLKLGT